MKFDSKSTLKLEKLPLKALASVMKDLDAEGVDRLLEARSDLIPLTAKPEFIKWFLFDKAGRVPQNYASPECLDCRLARKNLCVSLVKAFRDSEFDGRNNPINFRYGTEYAPLQYNPHGAPHISVLTNFDLLPPDENGRRYMRQRTMKMHQVRPLARGSYHPYSSDPILPSHYQGLTTDGTELKDNIFTKFKDELTEEVRSGKVAVPLEFRNLKPPTVVSCNSEDNIGKEVNPSEVSLPANTELPPAVDVNELPKIDKEKFHDLIRGEKNDQIPIDLKLDLPSHIPPNNTIKVKDWAEFESKYLNLPHRTQGVPEVKTYQECVKTFKRTNDTSFELNPDYSKVVKIDQIKLLNEFDKLEKLVEIDSRTN